MIKLNYIIDKFSAALNKYSQQAQPKTFNPKFTSFIQVTIPSITQAISNLNAAKTLMKDSIAISATDNIVKYLSWYKTIGLGGNVSAVGKNELIPNVEQIKAIVNTGLFGKEFISSLLSILQMNQAILQINAEFAKLLQK